MTLPEDDSGTQKIESGLENKLKNHSSTNVHVQMTFNHELSPEERQFFESEDLHLLVYRHNHSWYISIPVDKLNLIAQNESIIRIADIPVKNKLSPRVREDDIGYWAFNDDGTVKLKVTFFADVPNDVARRIIEKYGAQIYSEQLRYGPGMLNDYNMNIPKEKITELASEDVVEFISDDPAPQQVLTE